MPACQKAAEPTHSVVITSVGEEKITAIKAVREVTGLGLKDAKELIDSVPSVVKSGLSEAEAKSIAEKLQAADMQVKIRQD